MKTTITTEVTIEHQFPADGTHEAVTLNTGNRYPLVGLAMGVHGDPVYLYTDPQDVDSERQHRWTVSALEAAVRAGNYRVRPIETPRVRHLFEVVIECDDDKGAASVWGKDHIAPFFNSALRDAWPHHTDIANVTITTTKIRKEPA